MRDRLRRLGRWLPPHAERDWFAPSFSDLEIVWAEDRQHAGPVRQRWADLVLAARTWLLLLTCGRLATADGLRRRLTRTRSTSPLPPVRREYARMIARDIRHAFRLFRHEPGFSLAAVLTLAVGIGANTALFAVVEAVLLRPLPFTDDRVVVLRHTDTRTGFSKDFVALGDVIDFRSRLTTLETVVPYNGTGVTLLGEGDPIRLQGVVAAPELFEVLRVEPALGRFFERGDAREGAPATVVISHHLWSTRFGSNPAVIGRSIQLDATRRTVVGVAPPGFRFPANAETDIVIPQRLPPAPPAERRAWVLSVARLSQGATLEQANAEIAAMSRQFETEFPSSNAGIRYDALRVRDAIVGDTKRALLILLAAVGFVLLIACVNVGNLLMARSLTRQQEMSIRLALGAGRLRLVGQMLVEGMVLATVGGAVGVALAWKAAPALATIVPQSRPLPALDDLTINVPVVLFSLAVSVAAAVLFSAVAAFGLTGTAAGVAATRRTTMSASARRAASALVAAEVALAVVLLIGAGLTLRSFSNLLATDPGFRPDHVVNVQMALPPGRYPDAAARRDFYARAFEAIEALPGVEAAGAGVVTPLTGNNWTVPLDRPERPVGPGERPPDVGWQVASSGFFRALGIELVAGRLFDHREGRDGATSVIISEALAATYFAGENPLGRFVKFGPQQAEIVGIVGDIKRATLTDEARADMYLPFEGGAPAGVGLFIRTAGDPLAALPSIQSTVRSLEPDVVFFGARGMSEVAEESAAVTRLAMRLLAGFAVIALVLAGVGIYGVMSYTVRRRTREMGTRLALGADRHDIVGLVLKQAATITGVGLAAGLGAGLGAARFLGAILHDVPPWDPAALGGAAFILSVVALLAGYAPARRAARVDPARTLQAD